MEYTNYRTGGGRTCMEMRQKPTSHRDTFFSLKNEPQVERPTSVATEFVDTDWDQETISDGEDNSPRASLQSSGQPSFTTLSSYDEVSTPRSSRSREVYANASLKQVEGPRGPHLFRSSQSQSLQEEDIILSLSPITPKAARPIADFASFPVPRRNTAFQYSRDELDTSSLVSWTPEMVAQSMLNAGIELPIAERFIENDINGAILITLKFEDLKELDIASFGIRTRVWHQIQHLRDSRPTSPRPATPIEDAPSREARREARKAEKREPSLRRRQSSRRNQRRRPSEDDVITPGESVSIIGIEQVIPKIHTCSKGENCSKWRKQQRVLEEFRRANPGVEIQSGGTVMIVGDAGNPETARSIDPNEMLRPMSDAVPSVVASSDVLGTNGIPALQYLQEATLRNLKTLDAQDNVRQFLNFQHQQPNAVSNDVPPTPPFQIQPPAPQPPHHGLRRLPRLSIPATPRPPRPAPPRAATVPPQTQQPEQQQSYHHARTSVQPEFVPYRMEKADPLSPDLETPKDPYRFATPFSEMDVPVTAVPIGPVARDASQSVPPDMSYRAYQNTNQTPPRCQSRSSRRPSFPVLPALDETRAVRVTPQSSTSDNTSPRSSSQRLQQPAQAPPRFHYPWSANGQPTFEHTIPPSSTFKPGEEPLPTPNSNGITHQGPMKKRKTRILRHEWQDGYFTLKGTRLNMHKDAAALDRTLEYVDIDDYAIACSSLASQSKLSAAFKAVHISSHNREKSDPVGAFSFQLIPQDKDKPNGARLRKRDSSLPTQSATAEGVNGTGKTHHFAVKGRDDRIDWMRELMLAKAMKQKGQGYEISVNGNMI